MESLIKKVEDYVKDFMGKYDASHDWSHIERVVSLAKKIEAEERLLRPQTVFKSDLIHLSALLHDVGDKKYLQPGESGDAVVESYLIQQGCSPQLAGDVQLICTNVSYTHETLNGTRVQALCNQIPELGVVQDADRLDAIGAVGIARLFVYSCARVPERGLSVEHFYVKLLNIKDRMKTQTGRKLAEERTARLRVFLGWWSDETGDVPAS